MQPTPNPHVMSCTKACRINEYNLTLFLGSFNDLFMYLSFGESLSRMI